jgi:hypothetical protein
MIAVRLPEHSIHPAALHRHAWKREARSKRSGQCHIADSSSFRESVIRRPRVIGLSRQYPKHRWHPRYRATCGIVITLRAYKYFSERQLSFFGKVASLLGMFDRTQWTTSCPPRCHSECRDKRCLQLRSIEGHHYWETRDTNARADVSRRRTFPTSGIRHDAIMFWNIFYRRAHSVRSLNCDR